jgi:hypothetical protein
LGEAINRCRISQPSTVSWVSEDGIPDQETIGFDTKIMVIHDDWMMTAATRMTNRKPPDVLFLILGSSHERRNAYRIQGLIHINTFMTNVRLFVSENGRLIGLTDIDIPIWLRIIDPQNMQNGMV